MDLEAKQKVRVESHEVEKDKKEITWLGKIKKPHKGMVLWLFNTETFELREAPVKREVIANSEGGVTYKNELYREKHCIYFWSLNKKNALRKLEQAGFFNKPKTKEDGE